MTENQKRIERIIKELRTSSEHVRLCIDNPYLNVSVWRTLQSACDVTEALIGRLELLVKEIK